MAWPVDWDHYTHLMERGRAFLEKNRFADSYREHCHALLMLLESLAINRSKEEVFRPHW